MAKVLVTDGHWRKTLALVRSLGRKGIDVTVGERTFLNTSFFSKYCSRRIVYPSPRRYPDQFIDFITKEIKENHYECLYPMEEETLLLLAHHRSEISKYTSLLIPDGQKIEFVRDKGNLLRFAESRGFPIPRTWYDPPTPEPCKVQGLASKLGSIPLPALRTADELKCESIAFPAISTGIFGFPKERAAGIILSAIETYFQSHDSNIAVVKLVLFDQATVDVFISTWNTRWGQ